MTSAHWESAGFREALRSFVTDAVGEPHAFAPVRFRPWSTVWRAETARGVFFAKDNCPGQRHEATLMRRLAELAPDRVVPVVAADPDRGWLLTPDQGETLMAGQRPDLDVWSRVVAAAAALQREVTPYVGELGLTVLDPAQATGTVHRLVDQLGGYPQGDPRRLPDTDRRAVEAVLPQVAAWSEQVGGLGLPLTLNHNDLHANNVFEVNGRMRFFDFGDAVLDGPLAVLRIPLDTVAADLGVGHEDPRLRRLADAALEVWSDLVPLAELRSALPAALRLGRLARAESWRRCLDSMNEVELAEHGGAAARWLVTLSQGDS